MQSINKYHQAVLQALTAFYDDFSWEAVTDGSQAESWPDLQEAYKISLCDRVPLPINGISDDKNIFGSAEGNIAFRAWHDAVHLAIHEGFSKAGEYAVAAEQASQLRALGVEESTIEAIWLDIVAQVEYYQVHKAFVDDQLAFTARVNAHGVDAAVAMGLI